MFQSSFLFRILRLLLPICIISSIYLYLYPLFHLCGFPGVSSSNDNDNILQKIGQIASQNSRSTDRAPFRLLVFGDPQLEGDTSLPEPNSPWFPSLANAWEGVKRGHGHNNSTNVTVPTVKDTIFQLLRTDLPRLLKYSRKSLDLLGNDYYLAHIYRTLHWWSDPTHVTVLGDLLGSQWIDDDEFQRRSNRYWKRVFKDGSRVPDEVMNTPTREILGAASAWAKRIINIAGNHDIGYAGDITEERVSRFERFFGKVNWEVSFELHNGTNTTNPPPLIRLIVLNTMNLDTPALSPRLQTDTYSFINDAIIGSPPVESNTTLTLLLTHIPLHKQSGVCVDAPYFNFYGEEQGNGIKEQNHLSDYASKSLLEGVFGLSANPDSAAGGKGRRGIIFTGHDHEGCDVFHHLRSPSAIPQSGEDDSPVWHATRWRDRQRYRTEHSILAEDDRPGVREVTLRAMMGEFGGNAALVSAWFDNTTGIWKTELNKCALGVQHIWWVVHILDLIGVLVLISAIFVYSWERFIGAHTIKRMKSRKKKVKTKKQGSKKTE
ncbi:hypothetical protein M501DRAFT_1001939 [Patellaria atrata CBS 101060]|uniref:Calcineurin-like phosphoesterase domain-containing protein n=1 Tax=Patellaria atrata CBS 101060 TaxID=1346257 RepID=A0A9P4SFL7_9PEZI|nr:hypothetical protein M501DRAFT_1001939 [Patellaria atrata CBS 101060]